MTERPATTPEAWLEVSYADAPHNNFNFCTGLEHVLGVCFLHHIQAVHRANPDWCPLSLKIVCIHPLTLRPCVCVSSFSFQRALLREDDRGDDRSGAQAMAQQCGWFKPRWRHVIIKWYREVREA